MKRNLLAIVFACLAFAACRQSKPATNLPPEIISTPQSSPVITAIPMIRTREFNTQFNENTPFQTQQNIEATMRGITINKDQISASFLAEKIPVQLENVQPFLALSAKWEATAAPETKLIVSVHSAQVNDEWSDWQQSSLDGDPRTHTGLFFFPAATKFIQYKIDFTRNSKGDAPIVRDLQLRFISPGATPNDEREKMLAQVKTEFSPEKILMRTNWHCPDGQKPHHGAPRPTKISHLIIHHTATSNDETDWPAVVRCIWNFHVFTNGWSDTGYHFLIDPDGIVYEGRAGGDQIAGSHFSCANTGALGIAMLGNFMTVEPKPAALNSLKYLLAYESAKLKINPLGTNFHGSTHLNLPTISAHRAANDSKAASVCAGTHCPGDMLFALLPQIRADVAHLQNELMR